MPTTPSILARARRYDVAYLMDCAEWYLRNQLGCQIVIRNPRSIFPADQGECPDMLGKAFNSKGWVNTFSVEVKGEDDDPNAERAKAHNQIGAQATGDHRLQINAPNLTTYHPDGTTLLLPDDDGHAYEAESGWRNPHPNRDREKLLFDSWMARQQRDGSGYGVKPHDQREKRRTSRSTHQMSQLLKVQHDAVRRLLKERGPTEAKYIAAELGIGRTALLKDARQDIPGIVKITKDESLLELEQQGG